jgi:hypothetical protein
VTGWKTASIIVGTLLIAYGLANLEIVRRARAAYLRGEDEFAHQKYKEAMWDYQEVQEFYQPPHTSYVDKAQEKEWMCRAYLGDWIPPEGPMDADVRQLHPDIYQKYKSELDTIPLVGDTTYQPAPQTPYEKGVLPKEKKKK